MAQRSTFWAQIKDKWEILVLVGAGLIGLGAIKVDYAATKTELDRLRDLNLPAVKAKVDTLDQISADLTSVKIEQAKQGEDIKYIRHQLDRRIAAATTQPGGDQ